MLILWYNESFQHKTRLKPVREDSLYYVFMIQEDFVTVIIVDTVIMSC